MYMHNLKAALQIGSADACRAASQSILVQHGVRRARGLRHAACAVSARLVVVHGRAALQVLAHGGHTVTRGTARLATTHTAPRRP